MTGLYRKTSGARVYPVEYTFDYAGRLGTMTTWQDYASSAGAAVTQWKYEGTRGYLTNKVYQGTNGPGYTYTKAGRLGTRTWARLVGGQPLATTYAYNNAGELQGADYSDSTPDVTYAYDRQGRPAQITGATTNDFAFTAAGLLLSENVVNKSWNYASQNRRGYDALQRRSGLTNLSLGLTHTYAYDAASRLQSVSTLDSGASSLVSYSYVSNSPLVGGITFQHGGTTRLTTSKSYDNLNRLRQINSVTNAQPVASFNYAYNAANQRTAVTNADGSRWAFGYDQLGQVTNGWRSWSDGSDVLGQTFNYAFDDIGNRKSAGTGTPGAQRTQTYGVNLLNQYTNRTVPGYLEVNGSADAAATVTVNGATPSRQGEYYRQEVSVNNASAGLVQWLTSRATNTTGTSVVARLSFVPQTPEVFVHDADGNLTQDGLWNYTWDGENRLTRIETRTNAITDSNYWQRIDCTYDYQSRRVRKQVFTWNPGTSSYHLSTSLRFFYDGWNLVGQVDEVTGTRLSFIWGTDLSGSMQGAGGVGGLKEMIVHNGPLAGTYFYSYDGNGNVATLVNAADGTEAARYEYGPFLEPLRATGLLAHLNPFRASTKYQDDETDLLYYGYRYLSTVTGRWIGRDPIAERGGMNVQGFVNNRPLNYVDDLGMGPYGNPVTGPDGPVGPSSPWEPGGAYWQNQPTSPTAKKIVYKVSAALQCVGGALEMAGGAALATGGAAGEGGSLGAATPVAVPVIIAGGILWVNGYDNLATGAKKFFFSIDAPTVTEQAITSGLIQAGVSPPSASSIASGVNGGLMVVGGGLATGLKPNCCSSTKVVVTVETAAAEGTAAQLAPRLVGNAAGDGWRRIVYNSATKEVWVSSERQLFHTEVLAEGITSGGWKIGANVNEQFIGGNALFRNGQLQQWNWASGHIPGTTAMQQQAEAAMLLILNVK